MREDTYELCYNSACLSLGQSDVEVAQQKLRKAEGKHTISSLCNILNVHIMHLLGTCFSHACKDNNNYCLVLIIVMYLSTGFKLFEVSVCHYTLVYEVYEMHLQLHVILRCDQKSHPSSKILSFSKPFSQEDLVFLRLTHFQNQKSDRSMVCFVLIDSPDLDKT